MTERPRRALPWPGYAATVASTAALAAAATRAGLRWPPVRRELWERINHAGDPVSLIEGPAYVAAAALSAGVRGRAGAPAVVAALGAGSIGLHDDLSGDSRSKGLRGHLGALRRGRLTTGVTKIVGLAATGIVVAAMVRDPRRRGVGAAADVLIGGAVVAGSANLINLLDLRPGRADKASVLLASALALGGKRDLAGALATGAALGTLPSDLAGASMLGDCGANAAGALLGTSLIGSTGRGGRVAVLAALVALTIASERVSFTSVIEKTPGLRELDAWGRG